MYQLKEKNQSESKSLVQARLKIGRPGDKYEQEADHVADKVMRMNVNETIQQQPIEEEEDELQPKLRMQPVEEKMTPKLRMQPLAEENLMQPKIQNETVGEMMSAKVEKISISEDEKNNQQNASNSAQNERNKAIQSKTANDALSVTSGFYNQLKSSKGGGKKLDNNTRQFMGNAMQADFNDVRIHHDDKSNELNESIQSRAFTYGSDIYFKNGEYNPTTTDGKKLIAHELTHTIQQGASPYVKNHQSNKKFKPSTDSVQRAIDTSILLHTYSLDPLNNATGSSGNSTIDSNLRRIESSAISSFGARNPVLNMHVEDKWFFYADSFSIGCRTSSTTSRAAAILQNCAYEYYNVDDEYDITFTYRHTGTRSRQGQFTTSSGRTRSQTTTLTGGAKLTYSIVELSASASSSTTTGSSSSTTVTATDFYEHDYDVSISYNVKYYVAGDFRINSDFFPGMDQIGGPHTYSGTANVGTITVYDDDSNSDNLTP